MKHFRVLPHPEEPELPLLEGVRIAGAGKVKKTAPTEAVGCIIAVGHKAKTGILAPVGPEVPQCNAK